MRDLLVEEDRELSNFVRRALNEDGEIVAVCLDGAADLQAAERCCSESAAKPDKTRPAFPYPSTSRYTGTDSIDDAANFVAGPAQMAPAEALQWLGSGFYSARYQAWCTAKGTVMTCQPSRQGK
jgi:hypothetical protein